jgi:hypothetical protein
MAPERLLEALLELAHEARLEVRVVTPGSGSAEFTPTRSAAARLGERVWVVLAADDPPLHQADVLAGALVRYRGEALETVFLTPGVRAFLERAAARSRSR